MAGRLGDTGAVLSSTRACREEGVKLPTAEMSFDDLVQTALKMTERQGSADVASVYGFLEPADGGDIMASWVRDFGGELLSADGKKALLSTPEVQSAWQFIYDLIYKHKVHPRPDTLKALGDYKNVFVQQKNPMFRHPPWGSLATSELPTREKGGFDWDAVAMPKGPSGQRGSQLGGTLIGVARAPRTPTRRCGCSPTSPTRTARSTCASTRATAARAPTRSRTRRSRRTGSCS